MHQLRLKITDAYTRTAARHIKNGDITGYTADDAYIYKLITDEQYNKAISNGDNEPFKMEELGRDCEYNYNYKK